MLEKAWRKRNSHTLLMGMLLVQPVWKTEWGSLKKTKIGLSYNPAVPLLHYQTELYFKKICALLYS